jgi:hypothetical protein
MAKYSKVTSTENGKTVVRYKDGNKFVDGKDVPDNVRNALAERSDGQIVDELGDDFDPETDIDESEDEQAPTSPEDQEDDIEEDESDADDEPQQPAKKPAARRSRRSNNSDDGDGEEGMGFPRVDGKTVDIFDGKTPHTHVKPVAGFMVPLSAENFANKSDVEIMQKLKDLGKIS